MGGLSDMWTPAANPHDHQWVGYDFGDTPKSVRSAKLKQFPNQYCAATPSLQYSDNLKIWTSKIRLECGAECPNNASGTEPQSGWTISPGPGTVAPPIAPSDLEIGAIVDWFSFRVSDV